MLRIRCLADIGVSVHVFNAFCPIASVVPMARQEIPGPYRACGRQAPDNDEGFGF